MQRYARRKNGVIFEWKNVIWRALALFFCENILNCDVRAAMATSRYRRIDMIRLEIKDFTLDVGKYKGLACTAPCSKYTALLEHGFIGDPAVGLNAKAAEVYADKDCELTAEFDVSSLMTSMKSVHLRLDGIMGACDVILNGKEIAKISNAHRTYSFDVKTKITIGKNTLCLKFDASSPSRGVSALSGSAPCASDMGISRKVELVGFNHKVISGLKIKQIHSENQVRLDMSLDTIGYDEYSRAVATLTSPGGMVYFCGFLGGEGSITISDPNLWWPSGLGMQNLYRLNVNLYSDKEIEDTCELRIGLRTVSFEKDEISGLSLPLINGVPMFPMGAVYKCESLLLPKIDEAVTRRIITAAKDANMNSVYVDGSSYYPDDAFFCACDEMGLLVWQQIPDLPAGADADDSKFAAEIMAEMSENLTRIAPHPSLGVIVGNPTIAKMFGEGVSHSARFSDFDGMNVFDPSGELAAGVKILSYDSLPAYDSLPSFASDGERNLGSEAYEFHGATNERVMAMLSGAYDMLPYPTDDDEMYYILGMSAAERARIAVESIRKTSASRSGIFFDALNDTWPTISSAGADYFGRRKPLHYFERRFFGALAVTVERKGTRVKFIAQNSGRADVNGVFSYSILDNQNRPVFKDSFPIKIVAGENMEIHNVDLGSVIPGHEREYYLSYAVSGDSTPYRGSYLFTPIKRFNFREPTFAVNISGNGSEYTVSVSSDCFAKGVELSFPDIEASVDDNYFDIVTKAPVRVKLKTARPITVEKLKRIMNIRSVYDLGR